MNLQLIGELKYVQPNGRGHEKSKPQGGWDNYIQFSFAVSEARWRALSHLPLTVGMGKHSEPHVGKMRLLQKGCIQLPMPDMGEGRAKAGVAINFLVNGFVPRLQTLVPKLRDSCSPLQTLTHHSCLCSPAGSCSCIPQQISRLC